MNNLIFLAPISDNKCPKFISEISLDDLDNLEDVEFYKGLADFENVKDPFVLERLIEENCSDIGKIYKSEVLKGKDLKAFITKEVRKLKPDWVITVGSSATAALSLKNQKKILLNPRVTLTQSEISELKEFDVENTYGMFDRFHERDYEMFKEHFNNADYFEDEEDLDLFIYDSIVKDIIKDVND